MTQEVKLSMDGMLLNWLKREGEAVRAGEVLAEIEADKATVEVVSPADGVLIALRATIGDTLKEGAVIALVGEPVATSASPALPPAAAGAAPLPAAAPSQLPIANTTPEGRIKASPLARRLADEKGLTLAAIPGTGPGGRIVKADVEAYVPPAPAAKPIHVADEAPPTPAPALGLRQTYGKVPQEDVEIIELTRMRRAIAENTIVSKQMTPHFYITVEMDVAPLLALREQINAQLDGIKVTVNDMVVRAAALALRQFPNLNTHYYGDKLVRHQRINIGIAVAVPGGLLNVVAHDADQLSLTALAQKTKAMIARARDNKLKLDDLRGSTFTVSNLGPYDVEHFSAVINPPEAAILAVSSARKVPVVLPDGTLGVGTRMKATLSVDHRVSDGAEGAQYMQALRLIIENPLRLV
ncbi:MAG: 2-oxo acid dehydrogenase subunit E2 [Anaerolineae bacterium]|nr:2-oxo acid dehydrogenase subunit E2 [Anaerolineae bacterium]MDW8171846.1 dihydrolipoamide acetyltransferase family protein [Anaerolineae bacterium]